MVDLVSYAAEFCLIVSIATYAHASVILLETFIRHLDAMAILCCSFIGFYLLVRRLPGIKGSFNFLYWKYFVISFLALDRDYWDARNYGFSTKDKVVCFLLSEFVVYFLSRAVLSRRDVREQEQEQERPMPLGLIMTVYHFNNSIGFMGMSFCSIRLIFTVVVYVLIGLLLVIVLDKFYLEYSFIILSAFLQIMDFPFDIPSPFDIIFFFICYYGVRFTGMNALSGEVLEIYFWGFIMYSITAIYFMCYYCIGNA